MMTPRSSSSGSLRAICAAARRLMLNEATRFRSMIERKLSRLCGPVLPRVRSATAPPAVVRTTCRPPRASTAALRASSVSAKLVTSTAKNGPPRPAATALPSEPSRSRIATSAPWEARSSALARPKPEAPPTTTTFLPEISIPTSCRRPHRTLPPNFAVPPSGRRPSPTGHRLPPVAAVGFSHG